MAGGQHGEDRLIGWLRAELRRRDLPDLLGDDVARLSLTGGWAVSADQQIEGVHFRPELPSGRIGRRTVAVNLSDLAAAGASPGYALVTVAASQSFDFKSFFRGLLDGCQQFGLTLAGGDLAAAPRTAVSMTVFGRRQSGGRWPRRELARPGDTLWLGGAVGESALGRALLAKGAVTMPRSVRLPRAVPPALRQAARNAVERHVAPVPQLELGAWLAGRRRAAAIDVSDGVLLDLERLARASAVTCEIDCKALPLSPEFAKLARWSGEDADRLALAGGEDYVLLFGVPGGLRPPGEFGATPIGRVVSSVRRTPRRWVRLVGARSELAPDKGWDHLERFGSR
ncbi:MAG: thiamine-phosphate kinase [Thermoanaerobaculia bacterium]